MTAQHPSMTTDYRVCITCGYSSPDDGVGRMADVAHDDLCESAGFVYVDDHDYLADLSTPEIIRRLRGGETACDPTCRCHGTRRS